MFSSFLAQEPPIVGKPEDLARRMAALTRIIRDIVDEALVHDRGGGSPLREQLDAFRRVLIHDLGEEQFADMYTQTIAYGLFAARVNAPAAEHFTRQHAAYDLPKTNPFLRQMFGQIAGPELDERITWAVDDLAELLARARMDLVLEDFGKRTRQEDPVVHFYETFLAAYDRKMREARGVYYTPEPVVSYIVRSVDHILRTEFGLPDGLDDAVTSPLVDELLTLVQKSRVDHTSFFRDLGAAARGDAEPTRGLFLDLAAFDAWIMRWRALGPDADVMDRVNPVYIPRNHLVEDALAAATEGDLDPLERLLDAVVSPYDKRPGLERYAATAPTDFGAYQTFCGT